MKAIFVLLFAIPFSLGAQQYSLVWSDEFNGTALDGSKWTYEIGTGSGGWGNNELQYYTAGPNNIFVDTGYLHIVGLEQQVGSSNFTSSRIKTQGLYDFQYGKVEARLKVPMGQGLWPAFWMLGSNITTVGWPLCGEIDIMEHINNELIVHGTHHYDYWGHTYSGGQTFVDPSIFHVYSIEWNANEIIWFVDGVQYFQSNIGSTSTSKEEFHAPFFLLLNLAIGGNWPGSPNFTTVFPATMMVDYVNVYQDVTGIVESEKSPVTVYPNPAEDMITISTDFDFETYEIFNSQGQVVLEGATSSIDIKALSSGIYYLAVLNEKGSYSRVSFVKQ